MDIDGARQAGLQLRQDLLDAVDHGDHVGTRLALDVHDHRRLLVRPGAEADVFCTIDHIGHIRDADGRTVLVGNDEVAVFIGRTQLVVGIDGGGARGAVETALGLVDVGVANGGAHVIQVETERGYRTRIQLHAHGRTLAARQAHQTNAGQLRNLLRQAGIDQVLHLGQGNGLGGDRQRDDGRISRIDLAVDRRHRQVRGQQVAAGVDGGLHFLLGHVQAEIQIELQRDHRSPAGAGGGHLLQARHLAELAFQGRGDRGGHHVRTGAGIERDHLDGRVIDFGQGRQRQEPVGHDAHQQDRQHQQGCGDRPQDELARGIHA